MTDLLKIEDEIRTHEAMLDTLRYQLKAAEEAKRTAVPESNGQPHPDLDFSRYDFSGLDLTTLPKELAAAIIGVALQFNYLTARIVECLAEAG